MTFVKSSFSLNNGTCVEAAFVRSSFCADKSCVEAAPGGGTVLVRDGKNPGGGILEFSRDDWYGFLEAIRAGDYRDL